MTTDPPDRVPNGRHQRPNGFPALPIVEPAEEHGPTTEGDRPTVLITGASGTIGRRLREAWADRYELVLIDRDADPGDDEMIVADLAEPDDWMGALPRGRRRSSTWRPTPTPRPPGTSWSGRTSTRRPTSCTPPSSGPSSASSSPARTTRWAATRTTTGRSTRTCPPKPDGPYGATQARRRAARPELRGGLRPERRRAADRRRPARPERPGGRPTSGTDDLALGPRPRPDRRAGALGRTRRRQLPRRQRDLGQPRRAAGRSIGPARRSATSPRTTPSPGPAERPGRRPVLPPGGRGP